MPTTAPQTLAEIIPGYQYPADGRVRGVVICGMAEHDLIERVIDAVPVMPDGYEPPIYCIEPDKHLAEECVDACELARSARVRVFTGDGCEARFIAFCKDRIGLSLPKDVLAAGTANTSLCQAVIDGIQKLQSIQHVLDASIRARLQAHYAGRQVEQWRVRYASILDNAGPARVMVVSSRFSTYVRHSAHDLAQSYEKLGHESIVLMEPDPSSLLTTSYYLKRIDEFDPDLIVCINFPRSTMEDAVPEGLPYVCWVQDAMTHLFTGSAESVGPLDFIAGHVYESACEHAGYRPGQILRHVVCASDEKFHAMPVENTVADRFRCDIAYLSHRSEPPQDYHDRFVVGAGLPEDASHAFQRCAGAIDAVIEHWDAGGGMAALASAAHTLASDMGNADEPRFVDLLYHQYVHPFAELTIRRQTLRWAAEISKSDGLSFRIYGNGWDQDPEFAPYAGGPIDHGDELRACYQTAAAHIHASVLGCGHQRVFECALSGGLPLCRRSWDELWQHDCAETRAFILRELPPDVWFYRPRWPAHIVANHPELMQMVRRRQLLRPPPYGWDHEYLGEFYAQIEYDENNKPSDAPVPPEHHRPVRLLGDPLEVTFSTKQELRDRVNRAATRPEWRRDLSMGIAARTKQSVSTKRFAERLLRMVGAGVQPARSTTGAS